MTIEDTVSALASAGVAVTATFDDGDWGFQIGSYSMVSNAEWQKAIVGSLDDAIAKHREKISALNSELAAMEAQADALKASDG